MVNKNLLAWRNYGSRDITPRHPTNKYCWAEIKIMHSQTIIGLCVVLLTLVGCRRDEGNVANSKMISSPTVMIVDEVYSTTEGYQTEGQRVTVRGSLNAISIGNYALFNSEWDPFAPEAGKDIQRLTIRFRRGEKPDDQLGYYVNVTGVIATDRQKDGKIAVTLGDAVIEGTPAGKVEEMTPRKEEAQQVAAPNP